MSNGPLILQPGSGAISADVVFVHGLRGDRIGTWSKGNVCWPRDLLSKELPQARIIAWGYNADVAMVLKQSSHASIFGHGQSLLRDIARLRGKPEEMPPPTPLLGTRSLSQVDPDSQDVRYKRRKKDNGYVTPDPSS